MEERDFGTAPILKLFFKCTIPAMVGMAFSTIYYIIDGIFVGRFIGHVALAAVNLVMPLLMITTALAEMVATGSAVRISILLGQGDRKEASHVFSVSLALITGISALLGLVGFALARPLIMLMGPDSATAEYAIGYFRVFAVFMPICSVYFSTDNYLRVCGKMRLSMIINIVCSILNLLLDILLIVVLKKGLLAAAFASCISMSVGAIWSLIPFLWKRLPLRFSKGMIAGRQMRIILFNGSSEFFVCIAGSVFAIIANVVLLRLGGATAVAAATIVEYVENLIGMLVYGMSDALLPALSYCFGAGLLQRMRKILRAVMIAAASLSVLTMLFLLTGGQYLLPLFIQEGDIKLYDLSMRAMRLYAASYLVCWIPTTLASYMTAVEKPRHSIAIALTETLVYPLIFLAILVPLWGLDGVWLLYVVSGVFSAITSIIIVRRAKITAIPEQAYNDSQETIRRHNMTSLP